MFLKKTFNLEHFRVNLTLFLLSLLFTGIFFYFFISLDNYLSNSIDRNAYINAFIRGTSYFDHVENAPFITYFTREWLWNEGVQVIVNFVGDVDLVLLMISLCLIFIFTAFVFYNTSFIYYIFLLNPLFVDLVFSQLRIGVALTFLLLAYFFRKKKALAFIIALMGLSIHTSSVIFVVGYVLIDYIGNVEKFKKYKVQIAIFIGFMASFMMGPLRDVILTLLNDRRVDYPDVSSGLLYMSYWVFLLGALIVNSKKINDNTLVLVGMFILSIACFNTIFGFYSARFIAIGLPFFAYTIYHTAISAGERFFLLLSYFGFNLVLWYYWYLALY